MLLFASAVAFAFSVIQMVLTQIPIAQTEVGIIGLAMCAGTLLVTTLCVAIESVALVGGTAEFGKNRTLS